MCHPDVQNWIRWAKFEQKNGFVMKVNNRLVVTGLYYPF